LFYVLSRKKKSILGAALLVRQVEPLRRLQVWRSGRRLSRVTPLDYYRQSTVSSGALKQLSNRGRVLGSRDRLETRWSASKAWETRLVKKISGEKATVANNPTRTISR
jgi:hypothetical protein